MYTVTVSKGKIICGKTGRVSVCVCEEIEAFVNRGGGKVLEIFAREYKRCREIGNPCVRT